MSTLAENSPAMLETLCQAIGDLSKVQLLEIKVPGLLEVLGTFETLSNLLPIIRIGYSDKANIPQDIKGGDTSTQATKNADTGLPFEGNELQHLKLVKERLFPSLFADFGKLPSFAKFICLRRFAAMAQIELSPKFLRDVKNNILAHLFYKLTLIMFKDALGDELSVGDFPLGKLLSEKIRENDMGGSDATSEAFFLETFIKFWCSLRAIPSNRSDEQSGKH